MEDTPQLLQSALIGIIFSFVIAKLISSLISRVSSPPPNQEPPQQQEQHQTEPKPNLEIKEVVEEQEEKRSERVVTDDDDDEDWEGVEYTELDEIFSAATAFVAASASADRSVTSEDKLKLYGFYKIATEGCCTSPQPSAINMSARAKWNAWQRLGSMSSEDAMQNYIALVSELYPSWATGSASNRKDGDTDASTSASKSMMGPVFSSFVYEEDSDNESKLEEIHEFAREGEIDNLHKYIENGVSVNLKDSEGRTPLHWAVDRGHTNMVKLLLSNNADVNAKDNEGQAPLHYAAMCAREDIAELLVKQNADRDLKDNEGNSPADLCETKSSWLQS